MTGGQKLREMRTEMGLTTEALGESLGVSQSTVSRIETGRQRPDWRTLEAIHAFSGGAISPNDFANATDGDAPNDGQRELTG